MYQPNTLRINDVEYVRKDSIEAEIVTFTGEESVATRMVGKPVIVRSYNEGINAGIVVMADATGVELKDCRRIWYHKPKNKNISWYEGVAMSGISEDSKVSGTVLRKLIIEKYSMTLCTPESYKSIMDLKPNAQR